MDYDPVAPSYDRRYEVNRLEGVAVLLRGLAAGAGGGAALEVGCGTGRWLAEVQSVASHVVGLDLSPGMLGRARQREAAPSVLCGEAGALPFPSATFDMLYCVNAVHHFARPQRFMAEARRVLRRGGRLAVVGMDPHERRDRWYIYDYFAGTLALDLKRFPSGAALAAWMTEAGFEDVDRRVAERISGSLEGRAVLDDHFLRKGGTSQLTLLSDEAYEEGLRRIRAALAEVEARGQSLAFSVDIALMAVTARAA